MKYLSEEQNKCFVGTGELNKAGDSLAVFLDKNDPDKYQNPCNTVDTLVFTKEDYFIKKDEENKNTIEWIVPNAQKNQMEPILLKLEPGGSTDPDNPHEGEEFGYVLNGAVTIHLGNKVYRAKKGETFYYVSGKQHYLTSKVGATVLWISSPPTF